MPDHPEPCPETAVAPRQGGIFKLFLGYAPGVGKTYNMLSEAIRRRSRGEDVVIGVIESHGRKGIAELSSRLEAVPRRRLPYKGTTYEEMDVEAILARRPQVVLVDELAHTNIEGSRHPKRCLDVMDLLNANIDVLSTLNVQHIESLAPFVQKLTGVQIRELVPDSIIERANEMVLADLTPEALQTRMRRGDIYPLERVESALGHFFRPGNLIALRELTLRQVVRAVGRSLQPYLENHESRQSSSLPERIAVCIKSDRSAQYLIARAFRMAQSLEAELFVVYVDTGVDHAPEKQRSLSENIRLAENLGAQVICIKGKQAANEIAKLVREKQITQVVFGRSTATSWRKYLYFSAIHRFLRDARWVDVHIVTQEE